eukprot:NODE_526_length_7226_cov_0.465273.p3 type:complete len:219 gc:universal NODE_526_length_7226_cov_0.465273:2089-1433(-)
MVEVVFHKLVVTLTAMRDQLKKLANLGRPGVVLLCVYSISVNATLRNTLVGIILIWFLLKPLSQFSHLVKLYEDLKATGKWIRSWFDGDANIGRERESPPYNMDDQEKLQIGDFIRQIFYALFFAVFVCYILVSLIIGYYLGLWFATFIVVMRLIMLRRQLSQDHGYDDKKSQQQQERKDEIMEKRKLNKDEVLERFREIRINAPNNNGFYLKIKESI